MTNKEFLNWLKIKLGQDENFTIQEINSKIKTIKEEDKKKKWWSLTRKA